MTRTRKLKAGWKPPHKTTPTTQKERTKRTPIRIRPKLTPEEKKRRSAFYRARARKFWFGKY